MNEKQMCGSEIWYGDNYEWILWKYYEQKVHKEVKVLIMHKNTTVRIYYYKIFICKQHLNVFGSWGGANLTTLYNAW